LLESVVRRTAGEPKLIVKLKNSTLTNMEIRCTLNIQTYISKTTLLGEIIKKHLVEKNYIYIYASSQ